MFELEEIVEVFELLPISVRSLSGLPRSRDAGMHRSRGRGSFDKGRLKDLSVPLGAGDHLESGIIAIAFNNPRQGSVHAFSGPHCRCESGGTRLFAR
jgi:hypothetical protein